MNVALQEFLEKKYASISSSPLPYIEVNDGWFDIIDSFLSALVKYFNNGPIDRDSLVGFKIIQIKEKFGVIRIYYDNGDRVISNLVRMAEILSSKTCEMTGHPGSLCVKGGWYKTLSKSKAEEFGFSSIE